MQAKGNDAMVIFDGDWLTIVHSGLGAIARGGTGQNRVHVMNIAAVELTEPRLVAGWFTVVPADRAWSASPVPPPHRDPRTVRFSSRAQSDFEAIRSALQSAVLAARQSQPESDVPHV